MSEDTRPYVIRTYDRWIILAIVLVVGYILFRPMFAFAAYYRGLSFERMLSIGVAKHYYQRAIDLDPYVPEGWIGLGELLMMDGRSSPADHDLAIKTLSDGARANPKNGVLPFLLCRTYYEQGRDAVHALAACQESIRIDPTNKFAWDYGAWASLYAGNAKQAVAYWQKALEIDPHYQTALLAIQKYGPRT